MMKNEEAINKLFEELVPASGKAESKAGEIIRAYSRIGYRFYNDGDHIGIEYGKHTCNAAARFLLAQDYEPFTRCLSDMWGNWNEAEYEDLLEALGDAVLEYIEANPDLRTQPTEDMFDHYDEIEDNDCDDEEEDYYDEEYYDEEEDW